MKTVQVNKIRQHNSFCAGAINFRGRLLETLKEILPAEALDQMGKLTGNLLKHEDFVKIGHDVHTGMRKSKQANIRRQRKLRNEKRAQQ